MFNKIDHIYDVPAKAKRNLTHINETEREYEGGYDENEDAADYYDISAIKAVRVG